MDKFYYFNGADSSEIEPSMLSIDQPVKGSRLSNAIVVDDTPLKPSAPPVGHTFPLAMRPKMDPPSGPSTAVPPPATPVTSKTAKKDDSAGQRPSASRLASAQFVLVTQDIIRQQSRSGKYSSTRSSTSIRTTLLHCRQSTLAMRTDCLQRRRLLQRCTASG